MQKDSTQRYSQIWQTVLHIPVGKVASYGQVADLAGLPGRARLVGKALGHAPKHLSVPWHRVLRASGQIAFPAGSDANSQQAALLWQEGVAVNNHRVKLSVYQWQPDLGDMLAVLTF